MQLSELLAIELPAAVDLPVQAIVRDSRQVSPGTVYFALKGAKFDGEQFIEAAIAQGAVAVIIEAERVAVTHDTVPIISIPKLKERLSEIAARFYGNPSEKLTMIAITGTNGKTSTAYYLAQCLNLLGMRCAMIGTIGVGFPDAIDKATHTTPEPFSLQALLADFLQQGASAVVMEASSHGLVQHRLRHVAIDIGVFTNLTREHLDYHGTMENYQAAKRLLFSEFQLKHAVINMDDDYGCELINDFHQQISVVGYSLQGKQPLSVAQVVASHCNFSIKGLTALIQTPWGEGNLSASLLGEFNLSNLLAVIATLGSMGIKMMDIISAIAKTKPVPGRLQQFRATNKPLVVVDFAHTPDALATVLTELRRYVKGRLWCVFGCGGDRDIGKRSQMGAIAERLADQVILTNDNPRSEQPEKIIEDILKGLVCPWAAEVELDRQAAIMHAIHCADPQDVVLVAGKGHETEQIIGEQVFSFSDAEVVQRELQASVQ